MSTSPPIVPAFASAQTAAAGTTLFQTGVTGRPQASVLVNSDSLKIGNGFGAVNTLTCNSSSDLSMTGGLDITTAGQGVMVAEGANAKQGTATLSGATTTVVANTSVTASSRIFLTCQALGTVTTPSALAVTARTAGTSFTITASQATDTSTVAYEIFEPG